MATLDTSLSPILGDTTAKKLAKHRGMKTVGDLLRFVPRRHTDYESDLSAAQKDDFIIAVAEVKTVVTKQPRRSRHKMLIATITDGTDELDVTFFRAYKPMGELFPGVRAVWTGKVSTYRGKRQLAHPAYEILSGERLPEEPGLLSLYTATPKVPNSVFVKSVEVVFDHLDAIPDPIPASVRDAHGLVDPLTALKLIHRPDSHADVEKARQRFRFEEAFILQTALAQRRTERLAEVTRSRQPREGGLLAAFDDRLPFTLTDGQVAVGRTIAEEMAAEVPMHRLLQGEVGSGKTVVALRAMLAAVDAGGQAALLAPTEVLAQQHHRSITTMLGELAEGGMLGGSEIGTKVVLLTGSMSTASRRRAMLDIASGDAGLVIGTHALIQDRVDFFDLALVVVDEQHRFGVRQRDALREKGTHPPHVLVMTATPIPRTVAMTVFGDMETSTLRELPAGRAPITTHVVPADNATWMARTWARVAEEVRAGRQAYVVCPRIVADEAGPGEDEVAADDGFDDEFADELFDIGEDEAPRASRPMASVEAVSELLRAEPVLAGIRIEVLHGRLPPEEKDAVMRRFAGGDIDVLVATTVIEVGVDVANASVMVIIDADRFGVSQLHQLRGRVGRGGLPGLCLLVTGSHTPSATKRLEAVAATTDGFELARLDLSLRREGDILGAAQSGRHNQLEFLSVLRDEQVIVAAREAAFALVEADPELSSHPVLAEAVRHRLDDEAAAFLERG